MMAETFKKLEKIRYPGSIRRFIFSRLGRHFVGLGRVAAPRGDAFVLSGRLAGCVGHPGALFVCALVLFSLATAPRVALALGGAEPWIAAERGLGAESCPSAEQLEEQVRSLLDEVPDNAEVSVSFRFARGTFAAEIRRRGAQGVRVLSDTHTDCGPLGSATATSIALLLEMDPPVAEPKTPEPVLVPSEPRSVPLGAPLLLGLWGRGGVALGALSTPAPLLSGEVLFGFRRFRTRLGALVVPAQNAALGPGLVRQDLWAATTHVCALPVAREAIDVSLCSGLYVGILSAQAHGFTSNSIETRPWVAVPVEAAIAFRLNGAGPMSTNLLWGMTGLVPGGRERFAVEGLRETVQTWRVPVLVWVGLSTEWETAGK